MLNRKDTHMKLQASLYVMSRHRTLFCFLNFEGTNSIFLLSARPCPARPHVMPNGLALGIYAVPFVIIFE